MIFKQYITYLLEEKKYDKIKEILPREEYEKFGITEKDFAKEFFSEEDKQVKETDVDSLSWEEIKKLAKELGISQFQKKDKLISLVKEALQQNGNEKED